MPKRKSSSLGKESLDVAKKQLVVNEESRDIAKETLNVTKRNSLLQGVAIGIAFVTLVVTYFIWQGVLEIKHFCSKALRLIML